MDASESLRPPDDSSPAADGVTPPSADGLSDRDVAILGFERQWWRHAGSKEQAIRDRFGFSPTRYYQLLNKLINHPEAMAHDPMLVKRLRRLRASRARTRAMRQPGDGHAPPAEA